MSHTISDSALNDASDESPTETPTRTRWSRRSRSWFSRHADWFVLVIVSAAGSALALRIWRAHPRRPPGYGGDEHVYLAQIYTILKEGWWYNQPRLGAPFGQVHHDFPFGGDSVHILLIRLLGFVIRDPVLVLNSYWWLSTLIIAVSAYWALRTLSVSKPLGIALATLYANSAYHMAHSTGHLYRSAYFIVPMICVSMLWISGYDNGVKHPDGRWHRRRITIIFVTAALAGVTDTSTVIFPSAIFGVIALTQLVQRNVKQAGVALVAAALPLTVLLIANVPSLVYEIREGTNQEVVQRAAVEQELYALKVSNLLFPRPDHPVGILRDFGQETIPSPIRSEAGQYLGIIGISGLMIGVFAVLRRSFARPKDEDRDDLPDLWVRSGALAVVCLLLAVPGGFAFVLTVLGAEEFRVWNRIVTYVLFFAFVIVGVGLDRFAGRRVVRRATWLRALGAAGLVAMLGLGLIDQTAGTSYDYDRAEDSWNSDAEFYAAVEASTPQCGAVYNLPYKLYPETGRGRWYHPSVGILHTDCLKFSWGAMAGRPASEWQRLTSRLPSSLAIDAIVAAGFDSILVERWDYARVDVEVLERKLVSTMNSDMQYSRLTDLGFIETRGRRTELVDLLGSAQLEAIGERVVLPVLPVFDDEFELSAGGEDRWSLEARGLLDLENTLNAEREIHVRLTNIALTNTARVRVLSANGEVIAALTSAESDTHLEFNLAVPRDGVELELVVDPLDESQVASIEFGMVTIDRLLDPLVALHPANEPPLDLITR